VSITTAASDKTGWTDCAAADPFVDKIVTINDDQSVNAQVSVLCHELAHALVRHDHQDDDPQLGYPEEELVAESVAHLAVSFVGLDASVAACPTLPLSPQALPARPRHRIGHPAATFR
jgi:hypothetical protein